MTWELASSQGDESSKIRDRIATYLQGKGLDLGCGPWKIVASADLEHNCTGVDAFCGADVVCNVADLAPFKDEFYDYVYSSHCLEDLKNTEATLVEWWNKVKVDGFLILYLPLTRRVAKDMGLANWADFYPNMGEDGCNPAHQHDFHPQEIRDMMARIGDCRIEADEIRGGGLEYSFLQIYRKLSSVRLPVFGISKGTKPKALIVRYGACGDSLQSTPVVRLIKEQGYDVTVNCSDLSGSLEVWQNNPHVDALAVQRRNQVPHGNLSQYWADISKRYDRFINLTGAAEDKLLFSDAQLFKAMDALRPKAPEATELQLMDAALLRFRKTVGSQNYFDSHLEKAGLSERGLLPELYLTRSEELYAQHFRDKHKDKFIVLWSLAGSSYHKWYPWFQHAVQGVLAAIPDALVISVGEEACALMERAESPRYLPRAGRWKWRHTMTLTKYVDLVIGPETGVLNAAACWDTPKITLLSHSGHDNLCKYWKNDYCLAPENTFCHPCHTLHYLHPLNGHCDVCQVEHNNPPDDVTKKYGGGFWSCPYGNVLTDEDGLGTPFALCMAGGISPQRIVERVKQVYDECWLRDRELVAT